MDPGAHPTHKLMNISPRSGHARLIIHSSSYTRKANLQERNAYLPFPFFAVLVVVLAALGTGKYRRKGGKGGGRRGRRGERGDGWEGGGEGSRRRGGWMGGSSGMLHAATMFCLPHEFIPSTRQRPCEATLRTSKEDIEHTEY